MKDCGDKMAERNSGEAARFLERDFNQCFQQMRYYDSQLWEICKFAFTGYTATIGLSVGLYQFSIDRQVNLFPAAVAVLGVATVLGCFLVALTVRNRVYYVLVTRYVNEHRRHFLEEKPLGFQNATQMYVNPAQPSYFNWYSSQSWFLYTIAVLNSVLVGLLTFIICRFVGLPQWSWAIAIFVGSFTVQLLICIVYLVSRDRKGKALRAQPPAGSKS